MSSGLGARWRASREYGKAFRLMRAGQPAEAARAFERALALRPKQARTEAQRARALAAAGRTAEAIRAARQAGEWAPRSHVPPLFLGQIQHDAGAYEEARKAFRLAAERDPENQLVQAYLGLTALAAGPFEEGAALLAQHLLFGYERLEARVLVRAERYLWEHRDRARTLEQQLTVDEGARDAAAAGLTLRTISAFRSVLLWPLARLRGNKGVHLLRAEEAMSVHDFEGAVRHYRAAEAARADPMDVALSLGMAYYEAGKPQAAAEQLLRLPEEVQKEPEVAGILGAALIESGRYEQARDYLTLAANRFRKDFAPAYYRGLCAIALGKDKEAVSWFEEAADRLNPEIAKKRLEEMLRVRKETQAP